MGFSNLPPFSAAPPPATGIGTSTLTLTNAEAVAGAALGSGNKGVGPYTGTITSKTSGHFLVIADIEIDANNVILQAGEINFSVISGTGPAPAKGATLAGLISYASFGRWQNAGTSTQMSGWVVVSSNVIISPNTTQWVDIGLAFPGLTDASLDILSCSWFAIELPA